MSDNVVKTGFGYEVFWTKTENYYGKIVVFDKPFKTDMTFQKDKTKSLFINEGTFIIRWIDTNDGSFYEKEIKEGATFTVNKLMPYSIECISPGSITEVGDFVEDTVYKLIPSNNIGMSNV